MSQEGQECPMPTPGPEHERILQGVGDWNVDCKYFMGPGAPAAESKATCKVEALGGFWTTSKFHGNAMGMPFTGVSKLGYDPARGKYVTSWIDSMMPCFWYMEGDLAEDGKTLNFRGKGPDMTGQGLVDWRIECVLEAKDRQEMRMYVSTPMGDLLTMENIYHRA